ncbi:uncharacterized protein [Ptychodera flava]|uniref:uncharacterized protein n=1 Tax=Ptychodera flava TaxID=63121 RepID=UPI00396A4E68
MSPALSLFAIVSALFIGTGISELAHSHTELEVDVLHLPSDCEQVGEEGKSLTFEYVGYYHSDVHVREEFDSTEKRGDPMIFTMGEHTVMKGWEEGLKDMCIGERRRLLIPRGPMQEGDKGSGALMPGGGVTLEYEFELTNISDEPPKRPQMNVFKILDTDKDDHLSKDEMHEYFEKSGLGGLKEGETIDDAVHTIFEQEDEDGDGFISHQEFDGPKHDEL